MTSDPIEIDGQALTLLFTPEAIAQRVKALARQIHHDYAGKDLLLVGVLNGAFVFLADLMRQLAMPVRVDFVRVASYGMGAVSTGQVRFIKDLEGPIAGKHVLVVEDILDTGLTLHALLKQLGDRQPASLKVCVLLQRKDLAHYAVTPDYVGFDLGDGFVVGYGIDYAQRYRELPGIYALTPPHSSS